MVLSLAVSGRAGAQFFQHVIHPGQGQFGMSGLLALAVGVELFGQIADGGLLLGRGVGEGEGLRSRRF